MPNTPSPVKSKTTFTNWDAFNKAKLVPVNLQCNAYKPLHYVDQSCHTNLALGTGIVETLKAHMEGGHGGGFQIQVRYSDGKQSALWNALAEAGIEAHDFRCERCDKTLRFHPSALANCMKSHPGKVRRPLPGGLFNFTFGTARPDIVEDTDEFPDTIE